MRFRELLAAAMIFVAASQASAQSIAAPTLLPNPSRAVVLPGSDAPGAASPTRDLTQQDADNWLDGYMPYALRTADIPGAEIVIVKDGKILTARGYGYADTAKKTPVDPGRTLFRPGSISKLFTWTAVMQLVEQRKLNLDADINQYLDFTIPAYHGQPVTLRQLMTHTGGFEEVAQGVISYDPKYELPLDGYLKRWTPHRIFAPGSTPAYSNWATALAGYIVQRASGEELHAYLERHIFSPLGMNNSTFQQPLPSALAGRLATPYPTPGTSKGFEWVGPWPAGAASMTATDMARFMIAHLQHGSFNGAQILRPETADMMHNSPLGSVDPRSLLPPLSRMELGFFETNINGREVIGHLGDLAGFHSALHLFLRENVGIYMTFNGTGKDGAAGTLRTGLFDDFADRYFPNVALPDGRVDAQTAAAHARMMAGRWIASRHAESSFLAAFYWLSGQAVVTVDAKGGLVIPSIVNPGGRPRQWVEIAPFLWRDVNGHDRLAAKVVNGKVVRWSFDFASPFEVFDRVPAGRNAAWLLPALAASVIVLLLTLLYWPSAFLIRRRFGASPPTGGTALRAQRASRLIAGLEAILVIAWIATVISSINDYDALAGGIIPTIWALKIASILIIVGAVPICVWNAWLCFTDGRNWARKLWSAFLVLATLLLLYVALTFHVLSPEVHF